MAIEIKATGTRLLYRHEPNASPGDSDIWLHPTGVAFRVKVVADEPGEIKASEAQGFFPEWKLPAAAAAASELGDEIPDDDSPEGGADEAVVLRSKLAKAGKYPPQNTKLETLRKLAAELQEPQV